MIDFHSHVLPKMDDGSSSCKESCAMLRESYAQGVDIIAATSHFYAYENSPAEFLKRRAASWNRLREEWTKDMPDILLGAEVQYFEGICRVPDLASLCMEDSNLLLVEMPFSPWSDRTVSDIIELAHRPDLTILLAHIERYMKWVDEDTFDELRDEGVLMQVNAEFFTNWKTKRKALKMLENGDIDLLGSDCHNMDSRAPMIEQAVDVIDLKLGSKPLKRMKALEKKILGY